MKYPPLQSGIYELMRDLGQGLNDPDTLMLGGGNPAILEITREFLAPILKRVTTGPASTAFIRKAFQRYSSPQGEETFIRILIDYFQRVTGWEFGPEHVCVTQGSQQGFYMLYNYLVGRFHSDSTAKPKVKPVLLMAKLPDYIGYFDLIPRDHFLSVEGQIIDNHDGTFTYGIDFPAIENWLDKDGMDYSIEALIVSTPNNPSSHALTQEDANRLVELAGKYDKLLILDHAYGYPFPNIIYREKTVYPLTPHTLHCFSFSKIGFPGLRTGMMIGNPDLIEKMTILNGIVNLSPASYTCAILSEVLQSPNFEEYITNGIYPYYQKKKDNALALLQSKLRDTPVMIHRPEGGFFLWLRAPNFPLTSYQLYQVLKKEKVVVVPGNYFFLNQPEHEAYLRISYTMEESQVFRGIEILGDTITKSYSH